MTYREPGRPPFEDRVLAACNLLIAEGLSPTVAIVSRRMGGNSRAIRQALTRLTLGGRLTIPDAPPRPRGGTAAVAPPAASKRIEPAGTRGEFHAEIRAIDRLMRWARSPESQRPAI